MLRPDLSDLKMEPGEVLPTGFTPLTRSVERSKTKFSLQSEQNPKES